MKRKLLVLILSLSLLFTAVSAEDAGKPVGDYFSSVWDISDIFEGAEDALEAGADPAAVYEAMTAAAEENEMMPYFRYALETAAAADSEQTKKLNKMADNERRDLDDIPLYSERAKKNSIGFNAYDKAYTGSEAFMAMIADPSAQACVLPMIWSESDFKSFYGVTFAKFKPSRPRPGYACVVVTDTTQSWPETKWTSGDLEILQDFIQDFISNDMLSVSDEDSDLQEVAFTGNPNLASTFWVFDLKFVFYSYYGDSDNPREVRGFHTDGGVTIMDAAHKTVGKLTARSKLANRIYRWSDGIAYADPPELWENAGFSAFRTKLIKELRLEDSTANSGRIITAVNARSVINDLLMEQTANNKDNWQIAICESGATDVSVGENTITFTLRSYNPKVKDLGAYAKAEDKIAWLQTALKNASAYDLTLTLPTEGGKLTTKAMTTLKNEIKKAANTAKTGFATANMTSALKDWLFPVPVDAKAVKDPAVLLEPTEAFTKFSTILDPDSASGDARTLKAIACWSVKTFKPVFTGGPHAVTISIVGGDPAKMLSESSKALLDEMAFQPADMRSDVSEQSLTAKLAQSAVTAHTKGTAKRDIVIDLDDLAEGKMPAAYREFMEAFEMDETLEALEDSAGRLLDIPAISMPKTGLLSGGKSGTQVYFKVGADSNATYIQMQEAASGKVAGTVFVMPGKKAVMRVPSGMYDVVYCSGPYWYGEEKLFGNLGVYQKNQETMEVLGAKYFHTITLEKVEDGNFAFEDCSPDDFH